MSGNPQRRRGNNPESRENISLAGEPPLIPIRRPVPQFDRRSAIAALERLSPPSLTAFAALTADRLMHFYREFVDETGWGDVATLEEAIGIVWGSLQRGSRCVPGAEFLALQLACEAATPDIDAFDSPLASRALDAASVIAIALECCADPTAEAAADAAEIAWEAAFGAEQLKLVRRANQARIADPAQLSRASAGRLVRMEEQLQGASIRLLQTIELTDATIRQLRERFGFRSGGAI
jgi:uncharacterized protein YjaG (DUF416 family)